MRTSKYTVKSPLTLDYKMYCTRLILFSCSNMKRFDNERCDLLEKNLYNHHTNGTAANQIVGKNIVSA